ncbi:hypothetical protein BGZ54_003616, partial [Gamsiella multidivaricata]
MASQALVKTAPPRTATSSELRTVVLPSSNASSTGGTEREERFVESLISASPSIARITDKFEATTDSFLLSNSMLLRSVQDGIQSSIKQLEQRTLAAVSSSHD